MLSTAAFNAFLKTLEEPPHHAIFILATTEKNKILPTILSRCQTYDFARITIEDIVEHLQYVASCEKITTEPEALNIIAQKADGGMRDALSIFDQVVSFTGGNITYKAVIDNLNVLDYEYYFRLTDTILKGDVRSGMLILNDILEKGFDGQNIITGLANHFRDLLVCKDEATIVLFEVGASIRERYRETAKQCSDKLLFKAIELSNQCDLNFRNSQNKRLLLELTLILLCQLNVSPADEDDKKKNLIAPLNPNTQNTQNPAVQPSTKQGVITTTIPQRQTENTSANKQEIPRARSTSLKCLGKDKEKGLNVNFSQIGDAINPFSQDDLIHFWIEYAESLTIAKSHLKNTLISCKPTLKDNFSFEVSVYNPSQRDEISENNTDILGYLCSKLNNSQIKMDIRIVEKDETVMIYTTTEKYNYLSKKNHNLEKLMEHFNLIME